MITLDTYSTIFILELNNLHSKFKSNNHKIYIYTYFIYFRLLINNKNNY